MVNEGLALEGEDVPEPAPAVVEARGMADEFEPSVGEEADPVAVALALAMGPPSAERGPGDEPENEEGRESC